MDLAQEYVRRYLVSQREAESRLADEIGKLESVGHRIIDEIRKLRCGKNDADHELALWTQIGITNSPSRDLRRQEEALRLAAALETLPEDQRRAVELRHLDGYSLAEAATLMERSAPAFAGLLHRGLARLRELLKEPV